jgi:hypothetical protein
MRRQVGGAKTVGLKNASGFPCRGDGQGGGEITRGRTVERGGAAR